MTSRETGPLSRWDLSAALELMQMDFRQAGHLLMRARRIQPRRL